MTRKDDERPRPPPPHGDPRPMPVEPHDLRSVAAPPCDPDSYGPTSRGQYLPETRTGTNRELRGGILERTVVGLHPLIPTVERLRRSSFKTRVRI